MAEVHFVPLGDGTYQVSGVVRRSAVTGRYTTATENKSGAALITEERRRQVTEEGWTPEHDAEHMRDDLALAATCYATPSRNRELIHSGLGLWSVPGLWPWDASYWKPTPDDRVRELVKAGALIAAEIDRLQAQS